LASKKSAACWGLAGGFCALVNPAAALTWAAATLYLGGRARTLARPAVAALVAALLVAPWIVRNFYEFGRFVPVKSNLFYELYQSQCLQQDGLLQRATYAYHPGGHGKEAQLYDQLGETEYLDRKRAQFCRAVAADPLEYLDRVAFRFLGATIWHIPFDRNERAAAWLLPVNRVLHPLAFLALLVLIGSAFVAPLSWPQWSVMGVYVLYLCPYILASYYERYAYPLLAVKTLLLLWAADRVLAGIASLAWSQEIEQEVTERTE
jgi:hypothetical protein